MGLALETQLKARIAVSADALYLRLVEVESLEQEFAQLTEAKLVEMLLTGVLEKQLRDVMLTAGAWEPLARACRTRWPPGQEARRRGRRTHRSPIVPFFSQSGCRNLSSDVWTGRRGGA